MDENERRQRTLTDADVEALTEAMRKKWIDSFYKDLGKGVWALVWRAVVIAVVAIAAYGALKTGGFQHIERGH